MNKVRILCTCATLSMFSTTAFSFEGFSAGLNVNFATASTKLSGAVGGAPISLGLGGQNSQFASIQAAYGFAASNDMVISVGGTYSLGNVKAGSLTIGGANVNFKGKDIWTIYVEPGVKFGPSTLAYAKIAYSSMKGVYEEPGFSATEDLKGWGLGAGVRVMINKAVYWQTEFLQTKYDGTTARGISYKPDTTIGTIGLGMRF